MKKLLFILLLAMGFAPSLLAQDREIQGIVFDNDSKRRVNRVYIYNERTEKGVYNNIKGEFNIPAVAGDTLLVAVEGYHPGRVGVGVENTILLYLVPTSISLPDVKIVELSPEERLEDLYREYKHIFVIGNSKNLVGMGAGGVGLNIDGLYSLLSRSGKNARQLQGIFQKDYQNLIIDYRYTPNLVKTVTGLSGEELKEFMLQYRPSYQYVLEANDYSLVKSIQSDFKRYQERPDAYRPPPLK